MHDDAEAVSRGNNMPVYAKAPGSLAAADATIGLATGMPAGISDGGGTSENLQMPDDTWVIADDKSFRLCGPEIASNPFLFQHLLDTGSAHHTRQLLAGALAAGLQCGRRRQAPAPARVPSLERYIYSLAGAYQTTSATPPTMRAVAERFRARGNARVADYCLSVADEETGHDRLALKDLEALGIRSAEIVMKVQPANAVALVGLFRRLAEGGNPISVLGYAYALERRALFQTRKAVAAVEAIVPSGTMATRCLRVHSALGTDARHVGESLDFIACLSGADRAHIARATFETAATMTVPDGYPGDEAFREILAAYRH
jgi:hypothetical protein